MRIVDSSVPRPITDRSKFDLLYRKGERSRLDLGDMIRKSPVVSKGEDNVPYMHLQAYSDPFESLDHWYSGGFDEFCGIMNNPSIPFDNIFTSSDGFVARQTISNNRFHRNVTWEFSRKCHSFVTVPFPVLYADDSEAAWNTYNIGREFAAKLKQTDLEHVRVLDLILVLEAIVTIIHRHRCLVHSANVNGPFYIKAFVENVWRAVPFIDIEGYLEHISDKGIPLIQDVEFLAPDGSNLESFVVSGELEGSPEQINSYEIPGSLTVAIEVFKALGIPGELLARATKSWLSAGDRRRRVQRLQNQTRSLSETGTHSR